MDHYIYTKINKSYDANTINERTKKEMKEIDEKYDQTFVKSLKVGMISGISTYAIIKLIQKL